MKYKQRVVFISTVSVLCFVTVVFKLFNMSKNTGVTKMLQMGGNMFQNGGKCTTDHFVTSDWMVEEIYDEMNFTTNSRKSGGLYVLHEKNQEYLKFRKHGKERLEIIVVPHSHNDPGWLWTLDTYYTVRTRSILTTTVLFLNSHPDFRMIWTETIFLDIWWKESPDDIKNQFINHVKNGRIEILSGGWVSVDEATTHYSAVLDQLIEGHLWLKEIFGVYPNISWSIDPFGYSTSLPYLWFKSGMKDMTVLRFHGALKQYMGNRHLLTFNWRQHWDSKGKNDILCHVEPFTLYNVEYSCGPDQDICRVLDFGRQQNLPEDDNSPIMAGNREAKNLKEFATMLAEQYRKKADHYKHNVLLMPHGDDFRYIMDYEFQNNYLNMKRLMNHINSRPDLNIKMRFGTVGDYFDILHKSIEKSGKSEPSVSGDFFTYTDRDDEYWSGYYTTRPFDKRMIRYLLELLKTAEMFTSYAAVRSKQSGYPFLELSTILKDLQDARRTHGLVQHHDAITGTSAHPTVVDFEKRIASAISSLQGVISKDIESLLLKHRAKGSVNIMPLQAQKEPDSPIDRRILAVSEFGTQVIFTNTHSQSRQEFVNLIVNTHHLKVFDQNHKEVNVQVNPCWTKQNAISNSMFEIIFPVKLPAMSFVIFTVKKVSTAEMKYSTVTTYNGQIMPSTPDFFKPRVGSSATSKFNLQTSNISLSFSTKNGLLQKLCRIDTKNPTNTRCTDIKIDWRWYKGVNSNAYCFGTDGTVTNVFEQTTFVRVVSGELMSTVTINHPLLQHTVTITNSNDIHGTYVYIENVATLLSSQDRDKELFMRLKTSVQNQNMKYFTDSNSFQLISRQTRNNYPMAANIFPITSMAVIEGPETRLTVHVAQPFGVGSFEQGALEFLIDRVPTSSGKGLEEPVTDNKPALSKFIIQLEDFVDGGKITPSEHRKRMMEPSMESFIINDFLQNPLLPFVSSRREPYDVREFSIVKSSLPCSLVIANVKTFISERQKFGGTGVTFHRRKFTCHLPEGSTMCSEDVKVNLFSLFSDLEVAEAKKMSLTYLHEQENLGQSSVVDIEPMELESFSIRWR